MRSPEQKFIHHGAQGDQDPYVQNGDQHQQYFHVLQLMLFARLLLQLVADKGVHELFAVLLLLEEPGGEEAGEK